MHYPTPHLCRYVLLPVIFFFIIKEDDLNVLRKAKAGLGLRRITSTRATPSLRLQSSATPRALSHLHRQATDRSKSPEARQNSMPQATMPDIDIASPRPFMLMKVPKFGTKMAQTINSSANTTSMPKLSQTRPKCTPRRGAAGGVFDVVEEVTVLSCQATAAACVVLGMARLSVSCSVASSCSNSPATAPSRRTHDGSGT